MRLTTHRFSKNCFARLKICDTVKNQRERRRIRVLPVDQGTIEMITSYISNSHPYIDDGLTPLFNINRHRAWQIVRECANRAGIPGLINPETGREIGVSPHRLRMLSASAL